MPRHKMSIPSKTPDTTPLRLVFYEQKHVIDGTRRLATTTTRARFLPDLRVLVLTHHATGNSRHGSQVPGAEEHVLLVDGAAAATRTAVAEADVWHNRVAVHAIGSARPMKSAT